MLTKTIDGLFIGTRYGVWVLGALGILASAVLILANFTLGIPSILICISLLLLSVMVALALLPSQFVKGNLLEKRFIVAAVAGVLAFAITGIIFFANGGFPELNLLFI